jgi:hypothetical protein
MYSKGNGKRESLVTQLKGATRNNESAHRLGENNWCRHALSKPIEPLSSLRVSPWTDKDIM